MDVTDAKPLPAQPNLEQYKKQAKDLLKACRAGDPAALQRLRASGALRPAPANEADGAQVTLTAAQFTLAREFGFASWPAFAQHLHGLARSRIGQYERAVDAITAGDLDTLTELLDRNPELVRARSTRTHRATLLHYLAANGVESFRQRSPRNAVDVASLLLRRGAEADAVASMYGADDATTMEMLVSSVHPAAVGVQVPLVDTLIDFGAAPNGPADDGRPLLTAVAFQYPDAAHALVRRGARVDNLVTAAGLGDEALVGHFLDEDGRLRPGVRVVGLGTGLRRRAQENIDWAFVLAAALGCTRVVESLASRGVDTGARAMVGFTAAHWAAINGHLDVIEVLLRHHAPLEDATNDHHATVLNAATWAAVNAARDQHPLIVERLLAAGAVADAITLPTGSERIDALVRQHRVAG